MSRRRHADVAYLKRVNRIKVTPDLLGEVLRMRAAMPQEDRGVLEAEHVL